MTHEGALFLTLKVLYVGIILGAVAMSSPPYFPIEISRCLASLDNTIFKYGSMILSALVALLCFRNRIALLFCLSMFFIIFFDDTNHFYLHMVGVALLAVTIALRAHQTKRYHPLVLSAFLYLIRLPLKVLAVWLLEDQSIGNWASYSLEVMQTGVVKNQVTLNIFSFCGILQWACFVAASVIF